MIELFYIIKNDQIDAFKEEISSCGTFDLIFEAESNQKIPQILWNKPPIISVCAYLGSPKCFAYLINNKANLSLCDQSEDHLLPIHFSIAGKNLTYFNVLCSKGSPKTDLIHFSIKFDVMPFLEEIIKGKHEEITQEQIKYSISINKLYATKIMLNTGIMFDENLIEYAKTLNNKEAVNLLQSYKEQLILQPKHENYLVQYASMKGNLENVKNLLIVEQKYHVNDPDEKGNTAFIVASQSGNVDVLQFLSTFPDIDLNHQNKGGRTALHEAAYKGRSQVISFLLTLPGLDPLIKTSNGVPFHILYKFSINFLLFNFVLLIEMLFIVLQKVEI